MIALLYSLCCIVWGSTWAVIRVGLREMPPFAFAASRMTLVAILLLPVLWRNKPQWRTLWTIGLFQFGVGFAFVFAAEKDVESGLTAVLFGTFPLFSLLFARWFLPNEKLLPAHVIAVGLGFCGLMIMHASGTLPGIAALLPIAAAVVSAGASVATKRLNFDSPPLVTLGVNAQSGAVFLWLMHWGFEREVEWRYTAHGVALIAYLAVIGSIVAFGCLLWLLKRLPIAIIGLMTFVESVFGVIVGYVWLDEKPEPRVIAGVCVVLASIGVAALARPSPRQTPAAG